MGSCREMRLNLKATQVKHLVCLQWKRDISKVHSDKQPIMQPSFKINFQSHLLKRATAQQCTSSSSKAMNGKILVPLLLDPQEASDPQESRKLSA